MHQCRPINRITTAKCLWCEMTMMRSVQWRGEKIDPIIRNNDCEMTMMRNDYNAKRPRTGTKWLWCEVAMMRDVQKPLTLAEKRLQASHRLTPYKIVGLFLNGQSGIHWYRSRSMSKISPRIISSKIVFFMMWLSSQHTGVLDNYNRLGLQGNRL